MRGVDHAVMVLERAEKKARSKEGREEARRRWREAVDRLEREAPIEWTLAVDMIDLVPRQRGEIISRQGAGSALTFWAKKGLIERKPAEGNTPSMYRRKRPERETRGI